MTQARSLYNDVRVYSCCQVIYFVKQHAIRPSQKCAMVLESAESGVTERDLCEGLESSGDGQSAPAGLASFRHCGAAPLSCARGLLKISCWRPSKDPNAGPAA